MRPIWEIGRNIGIKKSISDFSNFAFYSDQNTHTSDTIRSVRTTSLSFITKGWAIGRNIGVKKGITDFSFFAFFSPQNTHTSDKMRHVRPTNLSFIAKGSK